jgi:hypothetical protein
MAAGEPLDAGAGSGPGVNAVAGDGMAAGGATPAGLPPAGRAPKRDGSVGATAAVEAGGAGGASAGSGGAAGDGATISGAVSVAGSGLGFRLKKLNMGIQINSAGAGG